ncbi:NADH-quinone oxidoreductase subunit C [Streptomyces sp. NPDC057193]|uniref:NADH-quinone oxidoreductase subunit C n=1 Tax=Streptomyces sp. NPDC057193 TaxID=3346043 RepID=UPI0036309979
MTAYDTLPDAVTEVFGEDATAERAYDLLTVDVPPASWIEALTTARDVLGCTYFDWLSAVDEPGTGFRVCAHVVALAEGGPRRLLVRTTVPHSAPVLPTAIGVYAGAGWHERETHEMFGVDFTGHPHLVPLLLPENFEGHPLRKDFVLAARVAKAWPGAKEPGESHDGGPKRRQMLPPGVPDPNDWGPLKGQLPPAPARPARAAAGDRPARRTRSVGEGSTNQTPADPGTTPDTSATRPPRRTRTASEGSASQTSADPGTTPEAPAAPPRRSRTASEGSASQTPAAAPAPEPDATAPESASPATGAAAPGTGAVTGTPPAGTRPPRRSRSASDGSASQTPAAAPAPEPDGTAPAPEPPAAPAAPRTRSSDAPWHHARPAFDEEAPPEPRPQAKAQDQDRAKDQAQEPGPQPEGPATDPAPQGDGTDPTTPAGGDPA